MCILFCCVSVLAKEPDYTLNPEEKALLKESMEKTKINMVASSDIKGNPTEYQSDGDPMTLEIVMLEKGVGVDHVSEDGEVIFMHEKTKDKVQQNLFSQAFYLRTKKQMAEKNSQIQNSSASK